MESVYVLLTLDHLPMYISGVKVLTLKDLPHSPANCMLTQFSTHQYELTSIGHEKDKHFPQ